MGTQKISKQLLDLLQVEASQLEKAAGTDGLRLEFEHGLTVEIHEPDSDTCRLSTRICQLGQTMTVQEKQLKRSLEIFQEVLGDWSNAMTVAISANDSCLRCMTERHNEQVKPDELYEWLANFVDNAYAYKQTFIQLGHQPTPA